MRREEEQLNTFDKELLLKDLCSRLPYKIAVEDEYGDILYLDYKDVHFEHYINNILEGNIKPYLFPISSMTEEQKGFLIKNYKFTFDSCGDNITNGVYSSAFNRTIYHTINEEDLSNIIDWLNKNHFDYRGLIGKGLAIDATGLNVY